MDGAHELRGEAVIGFGRLALVFPACAVLGLARPAWAEEPGGEPVDQAETQEPVPPPAPTPTPIPSDDPVPVVTPENPPPAAPAVARLDYTVRCEESAFQGEVSRLTERHPTRVSRLVVGTSRGGREIVVLAVTDAASGPLDAKPAVLLVTGLDPAFESRPAGPEAALYAARALLERAQSDAATAAWLSSSGVYILPAPDPDQTFAPDHTLPRACRLDRNFPSGWRPWSSETCAQGPYPLSEPETQAIARYLSARTNIGGVVLLSRGKDLASQPVSLEPSESERILFGRVSADEAGANADSSGAAEANLRRALEFSSESGSLAAFCRSRMSAFVWPQNPFDGALVDTPLGRAPSDFARLVPSLAKVAAELPRIVCTVVKSERLRERLWKIDLEVQNLGLLSTLPETERARSQGSVWFEAAGGRIAQVGVSRGSSAQTNARARPPNSWFLGHLAGREKLDVFLVVEAAEGTNLELAFGTLRAGTSRCATILH